MRRSYVFFAALFEICACSEGLVPASSARVAAWGDSITFGYGVAVGEDYPSQLSLALRRPVFNGGVNSETSSDILLRIAHDTTHRQDVVILWMGRNNPQFPEVVMADVEAAVRLIAPNQRFLVLSILNRSWEIPGTPEYANLMTLNARLKQRWGEHYLDMRGYLVSRYDPTNQIDVTLHAEDAVPFTLRSDEVHPNARGYQLIAQRIAEEITSRGW